MNLSRWQFDPTSADELIQPNGFDNLCRLVASSSSLLGELVERICSGISVAKSSSSSSSRIRPEPLALDAKRAACISTRRRRSSWLRRICRHRRPAAVPLQVSAGKAAAAAAKGKPKPVEHGNRLLPSRCGASSRVAGLAPQSHSSVAVQWERLERRQVTSGRQFPLISLCLPLCLPL